MKGKRITACLLALFIVISSVATVSASAIGYYAHIDYLGTYDNPDRFELCYFVGSTFDRLDAETWDLYEKSRSSSEIKWGNTYVSVTGTGSGKITRVCLHSGDKNYCLGKLCPGLGSSDAMATISNDNYGFVWDRDLNRNGEDWVIYKNSSSQRFIAYKLVRGYIDTVYYGMEGYMPFG